MQKHMVQFAAGVLVLSSNNRPVTEPLPTYNPTIDQMPGNPFAQAEVAPVDAGLTKEEIDAKAAKEQEEADAKAAEELARKAQEDADAEAKRLADAKAAKPAAAKPAAAKEEAK